MHPYLKLSCSLVFTGLLLTACQKETLLIPDQPASMASTSGKPRPPSSFPAGQGDRSERIIKETVKGKKTTIERPGETSYVRVIKINKKIWDPNGDFRTEITKEVWNKDKKGTQYDHKTSSTLSRYEPNVRPQSSGPRTSGASTSQRPQ